MVDALATHPHYVEHLLPIWRELPSRRTGTFYTSKTIFSALRAEGINAAPVSEMQGTNLTLCSAFGNLQHARKFGRLTILAEHGAGQSYNGVTWPSYIGAPDRGSCVGVLVPGPMQAERHAQMHPTIPAYSVGVPKLDERHRTKRKKPSTGTVAISFHWNSKVCKEAGSAWQYFRQELGALGREFDLLGHGHPRAFPQYRTTYLNAKIEPVETFDEVMDRADVYVCDNSSTLYEFASLDRPVVVLNSPRYRRDIEHGLRFWSHADLGPMVDDRRELAEAIRTALNEPSAMARRRRKIIKEVYEATDGKATERAAAAVVELDTRWG